MPLTYEQLAPHLYKWAGHFARKSLGRFQADELVAEVWLMGKAQKLKSIKFASTRAKHDMIDYIRQQVGRKNQTCKKYEFRLKTQSLQTHLDDEYELQETIPSKSDPGFEHIDTKDLFKKLCMGLCRQEALILKLRFLDDMKMIEIGKALDLSESRVSQLLMNLLPRIRVILENLKLTENRNNRRKTWENPYKAGTAE